MFLMNKNSCFNFFYKSIALVVLTAFVATGIIPPQRAYAQSLNLPEPGTMVRITSQFHPAIIKGIKIDPSNPLLFDFLIDPGQVVLSDEGQTIEYRKLIKFFLAALTTPEHDMWVNLSPYEHNRMIAHDLGSTEMGRDMLSQDYILKQLTASLIYPEESLGKKFWSEIYERVRMETGTTNVPVNTFNKVWIIPESATVFEKGNVAMVVSSHMKVLMEQDYLSLDKHANAEKMGINSIDDGKFKDVSRTSSNVVRDIILPAIEKEVNEGKNFAKIRQIYNSMILASWFKQRLRMHLLSKVYVNKNENAGVELQNPQDNERIYQRYLKAFKKGVFNYIKEDIDATSGEAIPRKYFSGGEDYAQLAQAIGSDNAVIAVTSDANVAAAAVENAKLKDVSVRLSAAQASVVNYLKKTSLSSMDLKLSPKALGEKISYLIGDPKSAFQTLLSLQEANENPDLGKNFVFSVTDIKEIVKNGLANWGGDPQQIVKVIKFLVNSYTKDPLIQSRKNIVSFISSNVWYDLHFQSFLSGLSISNSQAFAEALRLELEKAADDQPVGSEAEKVLNKLSKIVINGQTRLEEAPKNLTVEQWWAENQGELMIVPTQVDEDALAAAYKANLKEEGGESDLEASLDAQNAQKILQMDFDFLKQVSITREDLTRMYVTGSSWKVKGLLEKHKGFESKPLNQQIAILLNEAMNFGLIPTDLIKRGFDPTLVLSTALSQGYTVESLKTAVQRDLQEGGASSMAFLESPEAMQLASNALEAEKALQGRYDIPIVDSGKSFAGAYKGTGFFRSLFPKLAAAALFLASAGSAFAGGMGHNSFVSHNQPSFNNPQMQVLSESIGTLRAEIANHSKGGSLQMNFDQVQKWRAELKVEVAQFKALQGATTTAPTTAQTTVKTTTQTSVVSAPVATPSVHKEQKQPVVVEVNNKGVVTVGENTPGWVNPYAHYSFHLPSAQGNSVTPEVKFAAGLNNAKSSTIILNNGQILNNARGIQADNLKSVAIRFSKVSGGEANEYLRIGSSTPYSVSLGDILAVHIDGMAYKVDGKGNLNQIGPVAAIAAPKAPVAVPVKSPVIVASQIKGTGTNSLSETGPKAELVSVPFNASGLSTLTARSTDPEWLQGQIKELNDILSTSSVDEDDLAAIKDSINTFRISKIGREGIESKIKDLKDSVGGIDFDSKYLQLNTQGEAIDIPVPKGFDWLLKTPIRGFEPKILNIRSGVGVELSFFKGVLSS